MVRLSIIIPVLNEAEFVASAVDRAWALLPVEVIVVDGGSSDTTAELARGLRCSFLQAQRGRGQQQNAGARAASGDVLLFLHADVWLEPQASQQIYHALRSTRLHGAFHQRIESSERIYRLLEKGNALRARVLGLPYGDQGIFVRRDVFFSMGGFAEVPLLEDVQLMRTLRTRGMPALLHGPLHVSPRRWKKHGIVRQTLRNWLLLAAFFLGVSPHRLVRFYRAHAEPRSRPP